ncbi:MAG: PilT/PilU family type 4a pilus ATPase, partial [Puniceicoccales bacterium]|nr:PilT/PilU family type 4a pilus ATPase [Puniceicoccales bacterium]
MAYEITALIRAAVDAKASDIHLYVDQRPAFRVDGLITLIEGPRLEAGDIQRFAQEIVPTDGWERIQAEKEIDFAIPLSQEDSDTSSIRLRANVFYSKGNFGIVLRIVRSDIMAIEDIGFHNVEVIKRLVSSPRGLILVTGPTGSGKSTTLAAMIDWINSTEEKHIVTIEDPIEYIHPHKKCLISQRELGKDTPSFSRAIVGGMRQDPDIILVGEMRDLATVEAAVSAAETGHLVLSTLHTTGSARTVDRIIDIFPESGKELVRMQLASNLVAVISQVLCRNINGMGRTAAFEIMVRSDSISNLIREKKTFRIQTELETGSNVGMIPLDKSL